MHSVLSRTECLVYPLKERKRDTQQAFLCLQGKIDKHKALCSLGGVVFTSLIAAGLQCVSDIDDCIQSVQSSLLACSL